MGKQVCFVLFCCLCRTCSVGQNLVDFNMVSCGVLPATSLALLSSPISRTSTIVCETVVSTLVQHRELHYLQEGQWG